MNCYSVVFQLKSDRKKYVNSFRDEYMRASSEQEVKNQLADIYRADLFSVNKIVLTGLWSDFEKQMKLNAD